MQKHAVDVVCADLAAVSDWSQSHPSDHCAVHHLTTLLLLQAVLHSRPHAAPSQSLVCVKKSYLTEAPCAHVAGDGCVCVAWHRQWLCAQHNAREFPEYQSPRLHIKALEQMRGYMHGALACES